MLNHMLLLDLSNSSCNNTQKDMEGNGKETKKVMAIYPDINIAYTSHHAAAIEDHAIMRILPHPKQVDCFPWIQLSGPSPRFRL